MNYYHERQGANRNHSHTLMGSQGRELYHGTSRLTKYWCRAMRSKVNVLMAGYVPIPGQTVC